MRLMVSLIVCGSLLWLSGGCRSGLDGASGDVRVVVEGGGPFPEALRGRWQADRDGWQLVFEADGRISAAVISMGRVEVRPGATTTVPTRSGGRGVFEPGVWTTHYVPDTNELTVKISMDYVRVEMGENTLEGKSSDIFAGKVALSEGLWQAEWTTFTDYTARTPQGQTFKLATDAMYGESKLLTFRKVQEK